MHTHFARGFAIACTLLACDSGGGDGGGAGDAAHCGRFATTYARCFTEVCPNAAPFEALFAAEQENNCVLAERNEVQRMFYRQTANGTCGDIYFSAAVAQDASQASSRQTFCTQGPIIDPATCTEHCNVVTACLTPDSSFSLIYGEQAPCEAACIGREGSAESIACLAATGCAEHDCDQE